MSTTLLEFLIEVLPEGVMVEGLTVFGNHTLMLAL